MNPVIQFQLFPFQLFHFSSLVLLPGPYLSCLIYVSYLKLKTFFNLDLVKALKKTDLKTI